VVLSLSVTRSALDKQGPSCAGPTRADLEYVFQLKHGSPMSTGWRPRYDFQAGYVTPDDYYEALVATLITKGCRWLDVGCGRDIFPSNRVLAQQLSARCDLLVGVDPDETINENSFVHVKVQADITDFHWQDCFDVITLRMVAEHIADPSAALQSLVRLTAPGGRVVVYTVNSGPLAVVGLDHSLSFSSRP
jgi:2-polyprenyl-3-methyl-5-hydroxy-6-metoxy-1,4-benzoquinol methylase